jgi:integrase
MGDLAVLPTVIALERGVSAFLYGYERIGSDGTRKVYAGTLNAVTGHYGAATPLAVFDEPAAADRFGAWFRDRFGPLAPATYCRHLATCQSAFGWWRLQGWLDGDPTAGLVRPSIPRDTTRARPRETIDRLWDLPGVSLRDRTLWRLLYESAARAEEALSLDIEDLDLPNKQADLVGKGGHRRAIHWQTGTARLLPRLLAGRRRGPVFLAHRPPVPSRMPATVDLCPETGRARLSYRRAEEIFRAATGLTFHQLRHSRLTHEAESGTGAPLLRGISGHASLRSLEPYVANISVAAVAAHVARTDPAARRR